jgi:hypothetical protein
MTEQEAQALAARLERVWVGTQEGDLLRINSGERWHLQEGVHWLFDEHGFQFQTQFAHNVFFVAAKDASSHELVFSLTQGSSSGRRGYLEAFMSFVGGELSPHRPCVHAPLRFARWLPIFRSGCWLSGFPIEASAHEKAEWIQDFTREEVEAWNLKI